MRIKAEIVIDLSTASWAAWAGIDTVDVRADVIAYLTSHVPDLPGFCQTDAVIRWRLRGTPATEKTGDATSTAGRPTAKASKRTVAEHRCSTGPVPQTVRRCLIRGSSGLFPWLPPGRLVGVPQ